MSNEYAPRKWLGLHWRASGNRSVRAYDDRPKILALLEGAELDLYLSLGGDVRDVMDAKRDRADVEEVEARKAKVA